MGLNIEVTENESPQELNFNRSLPFYPLVLNYLAAIHGAYELTARFMIASTQAMLRQEDPVPSPISPETPQTEELIAAFYSHPLNRMETRFVTDARLRFSFRENRVPIDPSLVAAELGTNAGVTLPWLIRSAGGSLLISAWAMSENSQDRRPEWEFLRHCRNAAAHGCAFTFTRREPVNEARWRGYSITKAMEGVQLFKGLDAGIFWPGDPIHLLWDLEQLITTTV